MIAWVLVIWFGVGNNQSSFAVSNIASQAECQRLGKKLSRGKPWPQVDCQPYRIVKS